MTEQMLGQVRGVLELWPPESCPLVPLQPAIASSCRGAVEMTGPLQRLPLTLDTATAEYEGLGVLIHLTWLAWPASMDH